MVLMEEPQEDGVQVQDESGHKWVRRLGVWWSCEEDEPWSWFEIQDDSTGNLSIVGKVREEG